MTQHAPLAGIALALAAVACFATLDTASRAVTLAGVPGSVSGLGLVRALLPRRSAKLNLEQQGLVVCCTMELQPPSITWLPGH